MEKKISFIHCADIHMDASFQSMGRDIFARERRRDLKRTLEDIVSLVLKSNTDFLVVSGDLYEHQYITRSTIQWINEQFSRLCNKPVIIVTGNHDPCVKNSWYRIYPWNTNVHILTTNNPVYMDEELNVLFYGIGFDTFRQDQLPAMKIPELSPDMYNLCLFHGTIDMAFTQYPYNPVGSKELIEMGFDYYAAGHFHERNETLAKEGIINSGSPEPLGFDEQGEHGVYRVCLNKRQGMLQREYGFIPLQQRKYCEFNLDVGELESDTQVKAKLDKFLKTYNYKRDIARVNLTGRLFPGYKIDTKGLEQELEGVCFFTKLADNTRPGYILEELIKEKDISGVFAAKMQERISKAQGEEKRILEKALYLGLEALFEGKVIL